jgi:hypothetical protein
MWAKFPKHSCWKEALHQTCIRSPRVPTKVVAERLGIHENTLGKACNENEPSHLSSRHLPALVQIEGIDLACLDYLEDLAGRIAIVRPDETGSACGTRLTAEAMRAMGSLLEAKADSLEDGRITVDEAQDIRERADKVTKCVQAIAAYAERVAQPSVRELKAVVK